MKKFKDLVYFGKGELAKSQKNELINTIRLSKFHSKVLDCYDNKKGERVEVSVRAKDKVNLLSWLIAHGWARFSTNVSLIGMSPDSKEYANELLVKAKSQYPQNFK